MININLIAERRNRRIREATTLRWSVIGLISLGGLMVFLNFFSFLERGWEQGQDRAIQDEIKHKEPLAREVRDIEDEIARMKPRVTMLKQVRASEGAWMTVLSDLSSITPSEVYLDSLTADAKEKEVILRISGVARDEQAVAGFMTVLHERATGHGTPTGGWALTPELDALSADKTASAAAAAGSPNAERPKRVRFQMRVPVRGMMGGNL